MNKYFFIIAVALLMMSAGAKAQVTIGATTDPKEFSLLELISGGERGLRLPQMNFCEQGELNTKLKTLSTQAEKDAAKGLQVFNTVTKCVETWNGTKWIKQCNGTCDATCYKPDPAKYVDITVAVDIDGDGIPVGSSSPTTTKTMRFLTYNLGADPHIAGIDATPGQTAKAQMAYSGEDYTDVTVNGGLFQWGRKDWEHASRCSIEDAPCLFTQTLYTISDGENQYDPTKSFKFVWGKTDAGGGDLYNNSNNWISPHIENSDLWGNGGNEVLQHITDYTGNQNKNNPCPAGFRVPTEHEWALLGNENGSSYSCAGDAFSIIANGTKPSSGLYFVPVVDGIASSNWDDDKLNGLALYTDAVWTAATTSGGYFYNVDWSNTDKRLYDAAAPDPLLFLPAADFRFPGNNRVYNTVYGYYWSSTVSSNSLLSTNKHSWCMQVHDTHYGGKLRIQPTRIRTQCEVYSRIETR
jgi:hypothetical protein